MNTREATDQELRHGRRVALTTTPGVFVHCPAAVVLSYKLQYILGSSLRDIVNGTRIRPLNCFVLPQIILLISVELYFL